MNNELQPVTLQEQEELGLRRRQQSTKLVLPERQTILPPATTSQHTALDVPLNAIQMVEVRTSEIDRSKGYLMRTLPLSAAFAIVATIAGITLAQRPFLSWSAFLIFWLSFVGAWMFGEYRHGKSSPNSVALEEVRRKWDNIDANDKRRWDSWQAATGIYIPKAPRPVNDFVVQHVWLIVGWAFFTLVWVITMIIVMTRWQ